jgi:hypothetical protein
VAGAVLVLAVSAARILQLRLAGHRHNRAVAADRQRSEPAGTQPSVASSAVGEAQSVEAEHDS